MERCADRQLDGPAYSRILGDFNSGINSSDGAADNNLPWRIVIGQLDRTRAGCLFNDGVNDGFFCIQDRGHRAVTGRHRALHAVAAAAQQPRRIGN